MPAGLSPSIIMDKEDHKRSKDTYQKEQSDVRLDRHSGMGVDPNPKKKGHGGWGRGDEEGVEVADRGDPNYDSGDEEPKPEEVKAPEQTS